MIQGCPNSGIVRRDQVDDTIVTMGALWVQRKRKRVVKNVKITVAHRGQVWRWTTWVESLEEGNDKKKRIRGMKNKKIKKKIDDK